MKTQRHIYVLQNKGNLYLLKEMSAVWRQERSGCRNTWIFRIGEKSIALISTILEVALRNISNRLVILYAYLTG
jgi:hypothetical protein